MFVVTSRVQVQTGKTFYLVDKLQFHSEEAAQKRCAEYNSLYESFTVGQYYRYCGDIVYIEAVQADVVAIRYTTAMYDDTETVRSEKPTRRHFALNAIPATKADAIKDVKDHTAWLRQKAKDLEADLLSLLP